MCWIKDYVPYKFKEITQKSSQKSMARCQQNGTAGTTENSLSIKATRKLAKLITINIFLEFWKLIRGLEQISEHLFTKKQPSLSKNHKLCGVLTCPSPTSTH